MTKPTEAEIREMLAKLDDLAALNGLPNSTGWLIQRVRAKWMAKVIRWVLGEGEKPLEDK